MKRLMISAFALCVAAAVPTALWAADEHHAGVPGGAPGGGHAAPAVQHSAPMGASRGAGRSFSASHAPSPGSTGRMQGRDSGGMSAPMRTETTGVSSRGRQRHTTTLGTGRSGRATTGNSAGNGERAVTGSRGHVDVSSLRRNITASHRYHFGSYRAPQGYVYHRYSYGDRLPDGYFGRDYWILDYGDYGLRQPPDGYVWVRYGPDAVLLDEDTGEIVEIVYDQFY